MLTSIDKPLTQVSKATIPTSTMLTFYRSSFPTKWPATNDRIPPATRVSTKKKTTVLQAMLPRAKASQREAAAANTTWKPTVALATIGSTSR